ncbi:MAG: damage-inducible protein DinB [Candidatus Hydrogenedens sp.]|nr:DinB family protein [Candidatus Hydrogenedentota bacterium]NLF56594.1 damage-inducible protein DinB [Candidatus Hydrogenedens sp.]
MAIAASLIPEFDHETATTRRFLEAVPEDRAGWKSHPKSFSLGELAVHMANIPHWGALTLQSADFDLIGPDGKPKISDPFTTIEALLAAFDANSLAAREALESATDESLMEPWSLKQNGAVIFTLPRVAVLRTMIFSHLIHHRGQLSVYLRLLDVPLPSAYGPSADTAS